MSFGPRPVSHCTDTASPLAGPGLIPWRGSSRPVGSGRSRFAIQLGRGKPCRGDGRRLHRDHRVLGRGAVPGRQHLRAAYSRPRADQRRLADSCNLSLGRSASSWSALIDLMAVSQPVHSYPPVSCIPASRLRCPRPRRRVAFPSPKHPATSSFGINGNWPATGSQTSASAMERGTRDDAAARACALTSRSAR